MISYNIFITLLWINVAIFLITFLVINFPIPKKIKTFLLFFIPTIKIKIAFLVITFLVLFFGHILPYMNQEFDKMLILEYNDNINLYKQYSEDYSEAARQQIEQYQRMQSEMARQASTLQLQFFAEQKDAVGNSLTNEIRRFQNLIMEQELAINKAKSRILRRPYNQWYFGIKD